MKFVCGIYFIFYRVNNVTDASEKFEQEFDNPSPSTSNSRASENVQNLREVKIQSHTKKTRQNTNTAYLKTCQATLDTYISEKNIEKQHNETIQMQILEEFRNIRKA